MDKLSNKTLGGIESAKKIKATYGEDYFAKMGSIGGKISRGGGFTGDNSRAKENGRLGGLKRAENYRLKKLKEQA
jgi:general stress protein YciG